ncbi:hypothetical protein IFO69_11025 [Echinicola sp. CAU 1574]|uniref:Uncharacterized protein n=1 Tax=Echinicola arenosa TaxID=2774144 RepID=A0ABR9AKF0_9BACT|nr:DUF5908 family protein [Echinicola arenosa]MBD8489278.1 hypothetical protein [Echinicola arenosa]
MPIEIKELHIKINVDSEKGKPEGAKGDQGKGKQDVVSNCIEQVMNIIAAEKER